MPITPAPEVSAPEPRGLRYGLLTAANGPNLLPGNRLGSGLTYEPVSCGATRLYPLECDDTPPSKVFDTADEWVDADPFLVYSSLRCSAVGSTEEGLRRKVLRRFVNGEQSGVEQGMAQVLAAAATTVTAGNSTDLHSVVGELEQWLYGYTTASYGNVGYLHAPIRAAAYALPAGLAIKDGPIYRTPMGTVWVFGGGYPDDGSVYISGTVTVWRSADILVPPPDQTFDRALNRYSLLAEREYAVAYDCAAAVATFTPDVPAS